MTTVGEAFVFLKKKGFERLNQVGSHIKFGRGVERITVVMHRSPKEPLSRKARKDLKQIQ